MKIGQVCNPLKEHKDLGLCTKYHTIEQLK